MIDTIVLLLSSDAYTITEPEQFIPAAHWALNKKSRDSLGIISRQIQLPKNYALEPINLVLLFPNEQIFRAALIPYSKLNVRFPSSCLATILMNYA